MCGKSGQKSRSAEPLVTLILSRAVRGLDLKGPTEQLVRSLIRPFVCRRSLLSVWFTDKGLKRHVKCFRRLAKLVNETVSDDNREQKLIKYWSEVAMCRVFRAPEEDLPTAPEWLDTGRPLFTGILHRTLRLMSRKRDCSFVYSIQKGAKQCWPEMGEEALLAALLGHYQKICGRMGGEIEPSLLQAIRRVSERVFKKARPGTKLCPSTSACSQKPRKKHGSLGLFPALVSCLPPREGLEVAPAGISNPPGHDAHTLPVRKATNLPGRRGANRPKRAGAPVVPPGPRPEEGKDTSPPLTSANAGSNPDKAGNGSELKSGAGTRPSGDKDSAYSSAKAAMGGQRLFRLHHSMNQLSEYRRVVTRICDEELKSLFGAPGESSPACDVTAIALPEPGKFRIITKGNGHLYTRLQPLQGAMISAWKRTSASTMLDDDLTAKVSSMFSHFKLLTEEEEWGFLSIDYTAATDYLERAATVAALEVLPPSPDKDLGLESLREGVVSYPGVHPNGERFLSRSELDGKPRVHCLKGRGTNGQLMGSPLSFPLLCVINLAVYEQAVEEYSEAHNQMISGLPKRERRRRHMPRSFVQKWKKHVIINGDDLLCMGPLAFRTFHKRLSHMAGLRYSQGKNYFSPDCAMINSQLFRVVGGVVKRFGYLNQRLLIPNCKDSLRTPGALATAFNKMVDYCPWAKSVLPTVMANFKKFGKPYVPNWYLPVHLGGFGVKPEHAGVEEIRVSRSQRVIAARFLFNPKLAHFLMKGVPPSRVKSMLPSAKWQTRYGYGPFRDVGEEDELLKQWDNRLMLMELFARKRDCEAPTLSIMMQVLGRRTRFRPVNLETLMKFYHPRFFATGLPTCPPLNRVPLTYEAVYSMGPPVHEFDGFFGSLFQVRPNVLPPPS